MMDLKNYIFLFLFFLMGQLSAQVGFQMPFDKNIYRSQVVEATAYSAGKFLPSGFLKIASTNAGQGQHLPSNPMQLLQTTTDIPSAYCYDDLAFFCKIEVKLEKATQIPVRFRLGDVRYVDWLEGKTSAEVK